MGQKCGSVGSPAFSALPMGVLKRGLAATGPCGAPLHHSDSLEEGGKAEGPWSGKPEPGGAVFCCWDMEPNTLRTVLIFPEICFKDLLNSGGTAGRPPDEDRQEASFDKRGENGVGDPKRHLSGPVPPRCC